MAKNIAAKYQHVGILSILYYSTEYGCNLVLILVTEEYNQYSIIFYKQSRAHREIGKIVPAESQTNHFKLCMILEYLCLDLKHMFEVQ